MTMHRFQQWLLFLAVATSMGACGGGGDGGSPPPTGPANGGTTPPPATTPPVWSVTGVFGAKMTLGDSERNVILFAFGDSTVSPPTARFVMGIYGTDASTDFKPIDGFEVNTGGPTDVALSAFNGSLAEWALSASMDSAGPSVSGTLQLGREVWGLSGGAVPGTGYQENEPASLEDIQGRWTISNERGDQFILDVGIDGQLDVSIGSCQFGPSRIEPAVSRKNVFTVSVTGGGECSELYTDSDWPYRYGFAMAYPSSTGGTVLVFIAGDTESANTWIVGAGKR